MKDSIILKLVKLIEVQFCGMLIENKIAQYIYKPKLSDTSNKHNKLINLRLLEPYATELNFEEIGLDLVSRIRDLYPKGSTKKGNPKVIQQKLIRFLSENPKYTQEDVYTVIEKYVSEAMHGNKVEYLYNLNNIFYKRDGKFDKSPIKSIISSYLIKPVEFDSDDDIFD